MQDSRYKSRDAEERRNKTDKSRYDDDERRKYKESRSRRKDEKQRKQKEKKKQMKKAKKEKEIDDNDEISKCFFYVFTLMYVQLVDKCLFHSDFHFCCNELW